MKSVASDNSGTFGTTNSTQGGFKVGDRVVLCGLKTANHLNGRRGHVGYKAIDADGNDDNGDRDSASTTTGRVPVHLDILDTELPRLAVRAVNLIHEQDYVKRDHDEMTMTMTMTMSSLSIQTSVNDPFIYRKAKTDQGCLEPQYAKALTVLLDLLRSIVVWKDSPQYDNDDIIQKSLNDVRQLRREVLSTIETTTKASAVYQPPKLHQRTASIQLDNLLHLVWSDWATIKKRLKEYPYQMWTHQLDQLSIVNNIDNTMNSDYRLDTSITSIVASTIRRDIAGTQSFDHIIKGDFWVLPDNGDPDGSFLIPLQNEDMVYQCLSIDVPLHRRIQLFMNESSSSSSHHRNRRQEIPIRIPIMVWKLNLIPVYGRLVWDGILRIGGTKATVSRGLAMTANQLKTRRLLATLQEAKYHNRIIQKLVQFEPAQNTVETKVRSTREEDPEEQSQEQVVVASNVDDQQVKTDTPLQPVDIQKHLPLSLHSPVSSNDSISGQSRKSSNRTEIELLNAFMFVEKIIPVGQPMGLWFFRRLGYNDEENPDRAGVIVTQKGPPAGFFQCTGIDGRPTSKDILLGTIRVMRRMAKSNNSTFRPSIIVVDDQSCYDDLQSLFEECNVDGSTVIQFYDVEEHEHDHEHET